MAMRTHSADVHAQRKIVSAKVAKTAPRFSAGRPIGPVTALQQSLLMRCHKVLNTTSQVEQQYVQCRVPVVFEAAQPFLAGPPIAAGLKAELATDTHGDRPDSLD